MDPVKVQVWTSIGLSTEVLVLVMHSYISMCTSQRWENRVSKLKIVKTVLSLRNSDVIINHHLQSRNLALLQLFFSDPILPTSGLHQRYDDWKDVIFNIWMAQYLYRLHFFKPNDTNTIQIPAAQEMVFYWWSIGTYWAPLMSRPWLKIKNPRSTTAWQSNLCITQHLHSPCKCLYTKTA